MNDISGIVMTAGGVGDMVGLAYLARLPGSALVRDYPDQIGCDAYIPLE
ncbi:MAG: hypothetical protein HPY50_01595 [Firmicutes bacterium]|nr:hypothetical protein [Bacillota bacterium]